MRATENNQGSFLNRISIRRNQIVSMDVNHEQELQDLDLFQKRVSDRFSNLFSPSDESPIAGAGETALLSIAWLRKLLDVYLCCEAEFKVLLLMGRDPAHISKAPLDRLVPELLDRAVKSLDICNAVTHGVEAIRHCQKLAEIAVSAWGQKPVGDGQVRRAKKALNSLIAAMAVEDKDGIGGKIFRQSLVFLGEKEGRDPPRVRIEASGNSGLSGGEWLKGGRRRGSFKQCHPTWWRRVGLSQPVSSTGLYNEHCYDVYDVGFGGCDSLPREDWFGDSFSIPRHLSWAQPMIGLQEKIADEWKKKEKKGSFGLLDEIQKLEKLGFSLTEFAESFQFQAESDRLEEVATQVAELAETCQKMEEGLVPLQQQIREVFHKVVRTRTEVLEVLDQSGKVSTPTM
ncbi:hypothetical protein F8388_023513 [Cannabis sativa]|uniref:Uncharacterized protein n=1 Tax=Cannabis sativa TaxID=3483 RepID=A0A7J6GLP3_CANSA|nr:hypothetical protein F8388_023513 [Cannabis sativa]